MYILNSYFLAPKHTCVCAHTYTTALNMVDNNSPFSWEKRCCLPLSPGQPPIFLYSFYFHTYLKLWAKRKGSCLSGCWETHGRRKLLPTVLPSSRITYGIRNQRLMHLCVFTGTQLLCLCEEFCRSSGETRRRASNSTGTQAPLWSLCFAWHPV